MGGGFQFAAAARLAGCPSEEKPRRRWTFVTMVFGFCSFWYWVVFDLCNFGLERSLTFVTLVFGGLRFFSFGLFSWAVFDFCNFGLGWSLTCSFGLFLGGSPNFVYLVFGLGWPFCSFHLFS